MKPQTKELLESLDLIQANEAIIATGIKPWDLDSIVERVMLACDLWLLDDLKADKILVEQEYDLYSKGILDLILIGTPEGKCGIVDWKTTGNLKRPNFIEEIKSDFQSSLYLAHGGDWLEKEYGVRPAYIEYRVLDENMEYRSFKVEAKVSDREDANTQLMAIGASFEGLLEDEVWPRNRPRACFIGSKAGPTCPFYRDCMDMTMPRGVVNPDPAVTLDSLVPRSKSSMKSFLECPERFRRTKILGGTTPSSDAILAGEAFHSGMESLYKQALALK